MGEILEAPGQKTPNIIKGPDGKPQFSRRFALRAAGTALLGLALAGCAPEPTPVAAPAATAVPTAGESARQATAKPTIAPQAVLVSPEPAKPQRPPITANMLKKGLTGIGGPTGVEPILVPTQDPPPTEVPTAEKGVDIFSQARILFRASPIDFAVPHGGKDAEFQQINATGLNALKYIVAELSTYGMEGLNIDLEPSFLNNLDLLVARLKLGKLTMGEVSPPSLKLQSPANGLTIHRDTNMTIIGEANTHALVSFSDSTRGDNCEFIALIGQEELADLLRQNGYQLAGNEQGGLVISQDGSGILHPVQQIKDDKFIQKEIIPEMGATFVDELINAGKTSAHPFPVVPFPDAGIFSSPTDPTALKYQTSPDGRTVTAVDADGKILAIATYNPQKVNDPLSPEVAAWEWKEVTNEIRAGKFILTPVELKAGDGVYAELTKYLFQIDKIDLAVFKGRIFKDQDGTIFVLPPGVDTTQPMPWAEWLTKYSTLQNFKDGIIKNDEFVRLDSRKVVFIGANAIFVFPDDISVISAIPKIITQTNSASISHAMGNKIGSQQLEVRWNEKWKTAIAFDDMLIVYKYNDDNKWQELSPLDTEAQLKKPEEVLAEWLSLIKSDGHIVGYAPKQRQTLLDHLTALQYIKPEKTAQILKMFPWFHAPTSPDNPIRFLMNATTITNNEGGGIWADYITPGVKLDLQVDKGQKSEETQWWVQVGGLMKEALTNTWIIRHLYSFNKDPHFADIAPMGLELAVYQDLLDAKKFDGSFLISSLKIRQEITDIIAGYIKDLNTEANKQGWTSTYP